MNKTFRLPRWLALASLALSGLALSGVAAAQGLVVSESGQAVYSYPIVVPPGVAGMEPKLSLVYNSASINGPLGVGWSVQGISQITRCPKIEQVSGNGTVKPRISSVRYTIDDNLCLDGQLLVKVDTSQGWSGQAAASQATPAQGVAGDFVEFRTEHDSYSRIRASGSAAGGADKGPATFTVQTKAGLTQVYGLTTIGGSSKTDGIAYSEGGQRPGVAAAWMLKTVTDSLGNAIEFEYDNVTRVWGTGAASVPMAGREWNLRKVYYGCNYKVAANCAAKHQVEFIYDTRPDSAEAYHLGSKVVSTQLLKQVVVSTAAGTPVRNYRMLHVTSQATSRQLLRAITECAGNAATTCMPSTVFNYPGITGAVNYISLDNFNLGNSPLTKFDGTRGTITADFNGDGKTDLLLWTKNAGSNGELNELWLADPVVPGKYDKVPDIGELGTLRLGGKFDGGTDDDIVSTITADINGDGRMDLIRQCLSDNTNWCPSATKVQMWLSISDNDASASATYGQFVKLPNGPSTLVNGQPQALAGPLVPRFLSGWTNVCSIQDDGSATKFTLSYQAVRAEDVFWQDFDGDGRLDMVSLESMKVVTDPGIVQCPGRPSVPADIKTMRYYVGLGNGQFQLKQTLTLGDVHTTSKAAGGLSTSAVMDVDGDGRPDLLFMNRRLIQQPDGTFADVAASIDPAPLGSPQMLVVDANGDGKSDVIVMDPFASRTVPSPVPSGQTGTPDPVPANPYEARLFINQGGSFARDDRPLAGLKAWGKTSWQVSAGPNGLHGTAGTPRYFAFGSGLAGSMPIDINGDGLTDYMAWTGEDDRHDLRFFTSLAGTDAGKTDGSYAAPSGTDRGHFGLPEMATGGVSFLSGDFVGIGSVSFIRMQDGGNNNLWYRYGPPPDTMTMVTNLSGVNTWITYSSTGMASAGLTVGNDTSVGGGLYADTRPPIDLGGLSDAQARADRAGKHSWPTYHAHPAQWLVAKTQQQSASLADQSGLGVTTAFGYVGMKSDLSGAGDLGLESVTKYFPYANGGMMASTTEYLQPQNTEAGLWTDGTQRKAFVGMTKCSFTRYLKDWAPNALPSGGVTGDIGNSRNTKPGSPREQAASAGGSSASGGSSSASSECFDPALADKPTDTWARQVISMTSYVYCDVDAQASASSASWQVPCANPAAIHRPYQLRSVERTWDLQNPDLAISRVDSTNTSMTVYGDVGSATIATTGYAVGGASTQVVTKTTTNTYLDVTGTNFVTASKWFLGRLGSSSVSSTTDATTPVHQDGSRLSDTAKATQDPALSGTPAKLLRPEVMSIILQLLLDD